MRYTERLLAVLLLLPAFGLHAAGNDQQPLCCGRLIAAQDDQANVRRVNKAGRCLSLTVAVGGAGMAVFCASKLFGTHDTDVQQAAMILATGISALTSCFGLSLYNNFKDDYETIGNPSSREEV